MTTLPIKKTLILRQTGKCTIDTPKPYWVYAVDNRKTGYMFWVDSPEEAQRQYELTS